MKEEKPNEPEKEAVTEGDRLADLRDQMLRQRADFENVKKRLERDKAEAIRFANEGLLVEILRVVDTFDRAMASLAEGHDPAKVREGLKLAQDDFHRVLERHGVQPVASVGSEFDPALHEAVATVEAPDVKDGTVVDEVQRGYLLNGRLIRPSRVRIAQKKE
ncbi:MAG TPA: nucleotide exchange factor GrpE [Candidatus Eisenbacteria bacterium]|jgi:molecular chaperone GrpE|nr:nucleotide exchange factor GrpE [Candidatus Eisenbacteria bacterium]